jgi:hypothetical protein
VAQFSACRTIVEAYLRNREISIPLSSAIHFIPLLGHREYAYLFPALSASLEDADSEVAAVGASALIPMRDTAQ